MPEPESKSSLLERIRRLCAEPLEPQDTAVEPLLPRLTGIRAVLFDVYGTLLVSGTGDVGTVQVRAPEQALHGALQSIGARGLLSDAARRGAQIFRQTIMNHQGVRRASGVEYPEVEIIRVWQEVVQRLLEEKLLKPPAVEVCSLAVEYECRANPVWPMPEMQETLAGLSSRNFRLGIVSNAQFYTPLLFEALLDRTVPELGFAEHACFWSYKLLEAKPSSSIFRRAGRVLHDVDGFEPLECLFVGNDILNDIQAARSAGMRTALFAGDRRSLRLRDGDDRVEDARPDCILTDLSQLLNVLV